MQAPVTQSPVVVIGGGIMGCATAYYLGQRGIKALVLEKSTVASAGSGRSAGGVRAQCRDTRERALAIASIDLWQTLAADLDADIEYEQSGNIRLAANAARLAQLAAEAEAERADGLTVEMWARDELYQHAPYLGNGFIGGKYCPIDGIANPGATTRAFADAARRLGASIWTQTEVTSIGVVDGQVTHVRVQRAGQAQVIETPRVLHAAGPWTPALARTVGLEIPIRPVCLPMAATVPVGALFREFLSAHDVGVTARPAPGNRGQFYISGFADAEPTFVQEVTDEHLRGLRRVEEMIPALAGVPFERTWAGLLDITPDEAPILGPVAGIDGYWLACGFSGHGFCLGPIMGKLLSEWLLDGTPSIPLSDFLLRRFSNGEAAWANHSASSVIAGRLDR